MDSPIERLECEASVALHEEVSPAPAMRLGKEFGQPVRSTLIHEEGYVPNRATLDRLSPALPVRLMGPHRTIALLECRLGLGFSPVSASLKASLSTFVAPGRRAAFHRIAGVRHTRLVSEQLSTRPR